MLHGAYSLIIVVSSCWFNPLNSVHCPLSPETISDLVYFVSYYIVAIRILFFFWSLYVLLVSIFSLIVCWVTNEPFVDCILDRGFKIYSDVPVSPFSRESNLGPLGMLNKHSPTKLPSSPSSSLGLEIFNSMPNGLPIRNGFYHLVSSYLVSSFVPWFPLLLTSSFTCFLRTILIPHSIFFFFWCIYKGFFF